MGEALVDQLVDRGLVSSVADLYQLTAEQLMPLERMAEKSAKKVCDNIERSKAQPLARVLNGLGIPFVGERTAQILADTFGSLDEIAKADAETLQQAEEVGPEGRGQHPPFLRRTAQPRTGGAIARGGASIHR